MKYLLFGGFIAALTVTADTFADEDEHHTLDEIIVSATPLARTVEKLVQPTDVIAGDQLARQQSTSIGETLAGQPGVTASYFGPVASRPVIRGQFGERVRLLSNSLDALDASALSEDHAVSIDSILADRVEIVRGPATLLYGSGAAGGLVNIVDSRIHEKVLDSPFSGTVSLATASATDKRSGAFKIAMGNDDVVAHFDYFRRDTGNVEIPGFAESATLRTLLGQAASDAYGRIENTASETNGAAAGFSFIGESGFAGVSISDYDSRYGVPGEEDEISIALKQQRYDFSGRLDLDSGPLQHVKLRLASNDYTHTEFEAGSVGTVFDTQGTDARVELKHRRFGSLDGALGLQYKNIEFVAIGDEAFVPSSDTSQLGVFAFEELTLSDAWTLQASARVENQELTSPALPSYDDTAFGASIGALWSFSDELTASANFSVTERHPNGTELYADGPHLAVQRYERGVFTQGLGGLDKERSSNMDLTLRGQYQRNEFSITLFINDVADYILLLPTGAIQDGLPVFDYAQTDVRLTGFEAEWLYDIASSERGHLHARLFSDFVRGKLDSGGNLPRLPPLRFGAGLHFSNESFDTSLELTRVDEQTRVAENEMPTGGHTLLNASASYQLDRSGLLLFVKGTNLGDEDSRRHSSPLKDIAPLPGRSLHLGLRWDF